MQFLSQLRQHAGNEFEQAAYRFAISTAFLIIYAGYLYSASQTQAWLGHPAVLASAVYVLFSLLVLLGILLMPNIPAGLRPALLASDLGVLSYLLYSLGETGILLFPLYLLLIQDYAKRYGTWLLYTAIILALAGFAVVIWAQPLWQQQKLLTITLLLTLILLPLSLAHLLRRINKMGLELSRLHTKQANVINLDGLTGLPNRTLLFDRMQQALQLAQRYDRVFGVMLIDLDGFNEINENLGREGGDTLLKAISDRLRYCARKSDTVARLDGDRFGIMLTEIAKLSDKRDELGHINGTVAIAKNILSEIQKPFTIAGKRITITASIGIALYPMSGQDANSLIGNADTAVYRAKEMGKNTFHLHS